MPAAWNVPNWTGFIGQWDTRLWPGDIHDQSYRWNEPPIGLKPGFIKDADVAWYCSHRHTAAGDAFAQVLAAAQAFAPTRGGDVALLGWSLSHGLANLLIDGAFEGLPVAAGDAATLARRFSALALAAATEQAPSAQQ